MVHGPSLLLLDEPTSQLDPVAGDELVWLLRRLNEDWGTAVVVAEHRLERCLPAADRVIALVDGRVACDAPPREFLDWAAAAARAGHPGRAAVLAGRAPGAPAVGQGGARRAGAAGVARRRPHRRPSRGAGPLRRLRARRPPRPRWRCAASGTRSRTARGAARLST